MRLERVFVRENEKTVQLVGVVERNAPSGAFELYFDYPVEYRDFIPASADAFAISLFMPAMLAREQLVIRPPISPRLHFHLARVGDIFRSWNPELAPCRIESTPGAVEAPPPARGAATFFSGGVDSFFTLLKYRRGDSLPAPLDYIIFMRGFERPFHLDKGVEESEQLVQRIASAAGVRCIAGSSNLRSHFDISWMYLYCGSGLAATASSLAGGLAYVCIPSSYSYQQPANIGSTPLTDERLSTERMQIVHDGAELTRPEKLAQILEWDRGLVLKHLRVCVRNDGGNYNCCRCHKCIRTMVALRCLGALQEAATFPEKSMAHWADVIEEDSLQFVMENLEFARAHGRDPEVTALLEGIVLRRQRKEAARFLLRNSPMHGLLPVITGTRRTLRAIRQRRSAV